MEIRCTCGVSVLGQSDLIWSSCTLNVSDCNHLTSTREKDNYWCFWTYLKPLSLPCVGFITGFPKIFSNGHHCGWSAVWKEQVVLILQTHMKWVNIWIQLKITLICTVFAISNSLPTQYYHYYQILPKTIEHNLYFLALDLFLIICSCRLSNQLSIWVLFLLVVVTWWSCWCYNYVFQAARVSDHYPVELQIMGKSKMISHSCIMIVC